jgi:hypothetical protein
MAKRWKCARCATENDEGVLTCSNCRAIRGGVIVPGTSNWPVSGPERDEPPPATPAIAWPIASTPPNASEASVGSDLSPDGLGAPDLDADSDPAPVPTDSRPLWRRLPLQWLIVGAIVLAGGIGGLIFSASRNSTGEIVKAGDLTAGDLNVGDCWDLKDPSAKEIDDVKAAPCSGEHEYEVYFVGSMQPGDYPTDEAMEAFTTDHCTEAFATYVGKPYDESELEVFVLTPTKDAWRAGDRSIQCSVYHPRIHRLTKSLKGSAQ